MKRQLLLPLLPLLAASAVAVSGTMGQAMGGLISYLPQTEAPLDPTTPPTEPPVYFKVPEGVEADVALHQNYVCAEGSFATNDEHGPPGAGDGLILGQQPMTLSLARYRCALSNECDGFSFEGLLPDMADNSSVHVFFASKSDNMLTKTSGWSSFEKCNGLLPRTGEGWSESCDAGTGTVAPTGAPSAVPTTSPTGKPTTRAESAFCYKEGDEYMCETRVSSSETVNERRWEYTSLTGEKVVAESGEYTCFNNKQKKGYGKTGVTGCGDGVLSVFKDASNVEVAATLLGMLPLAVLGMVLQSALLMLTSTGPPTAHHLVDKSIKAISVIALLSFVAVAIPSVWSYHQKLKGTKAVYFYALEYLHAYLLFVAVLFVFQVRMRLPLLAHSAHAFAAAGSRGSRSMHCWLTRLMQYALL
jgi:hypothetical protein